MKRIVAVTLALLMVMASLPFQVFAAGLPTPLENELPMIPTSPTIQINPTAVDTAHRGDEVQVTLLLSTTDASAVFSTLQLGWEGEAFDLVKAENGEVADALDEETLTFTSAENTAKRGTLATLTFQVKENAPAGDNKLTFSVLICQDTDGEAVKTDVRSTSVFVQVDPAKITLDQAEITLGTAEEKNTAELVATVDPEDANNLAVIWTVENELDQDGAPTEGVLELTADGLSAVITGLKRGTATVKVVSQANEEVIARCVVTVKCSHVNTHVDGSVEATCTEEGFTGKTVCDDCGETIDEGQPIQKIAHTWEEKVNETLKVADATCINSAEYHKSCSVCGEISETETFYFGEVDPENHTNVQTVGQKDATYMEDGYTGDKVCQDCKETVEEGKVIYRLKVEEDQPQIAVALEGEDAPRAGEEFKLTVSAKNLPGEGVTELELKAVLPEGFEIVDVAENELFDYDEENGTLTLKEGAQIPADGDLLTITVKTAEDLQTEDAGLVGFDIVKSSVEDLGIAPAEIEVQTFIWGDANDDDNVDGKDIILLKQYMAAFNYETGESTVEVALGADANGDGEIDGKDLILLKQYMAAFDYETGESTVKLGPQS